MRLFLLLLKLKLSLVLRHMARKGPAATLLFYLVYCPFMTWGVFTFCRDGVSYLRESLPNWMIPIYAVVGYGLWVLLAIMWELQQAFVLDVAQRSTENDYLASLPVPLSTIVLVKSLERMMSDVSLPLGLGAALGFTAAVTTHPGAYAAATLVTIESTWVLGVFLFLLHMMLARRYTVGQIRQVTFLAQPLALLPFGGLLAVHTMVSDQELPGLLMSIRPYLTWLPPYRFATGLLQWEHGGAATCLGPLGMLAAAGAVMVALIGQLERFGWELSPVVRSEEGAVSNGVEAEPLKWPGARLFRSFYWKDALLLIRDRNLLGNALLLPAIVSLCLVFGLSNELRQSPSMVSSVCLWFALYFNALGAMNAAGMEGRGIWLARSLPVTPAGFLARKAAFWTLLTNLVFLPLVAVTCHGVGHDILVRSLVQLAILAPMVATLGVSLSAVFANYEAQVLQQGSSLAGKALYFLLASALVPLTGGENIRGLVLALLLIAAVFAMGARAIQTHGDPDSFEPGRVHAMDGVALAVALAVVQPAAAELLMGAVAPALVSLAQMGAFLLTSGLALAVALRYLYNRRARLLDHASRGTFLTAVIGALAAAGLLVILKSVQLEWFRRGATIIQFTILSALESRGLDLALNLCCMVLIPLTEEIVLRAIVQRGMAQAGLGQPVRIALCGLLLASLYPPHLGGYMLLLGLGLAALYEATGAVVATALVRVLYPVVLLAAVGLGR